MNKVVEVNAGLCTGTLCAKKIEDEINRQAADGWKFEKFETIIGRFCLFFQRYKMLLCFSKDNAKAEELIIEEKIQNSWSISPVIQAKLAGFAVSLIIAAAGTVLAVIDTILAKIFTSGGTSFGVFGIVIILLLDIFGVGFIVFRFYSLLNRKTESIKTLKIEGTIIAVVILVGLAVFGVSKIKSASPTFSSSKTTIVNSDKSIKTNLVGTWICENGWQSEKLTFKKDGTFEYNANYRHGGPEQLSVGPSGELTTRVGFDSTGTIKITDGNISHWEFKTFLNYGISGLDIQEGSQIDMPLIVISKDEFQMGRQIFTRQ